MNRLLRIGMVSLGRVVKDITIPHGENVICGNEDPSNTVSVDDGICIEPHNLFEFRDGAYVLRYTPAVTRGWVQQDPSDGRMELHRGSELEPPEIARELRLLPTARGIVMISEMSLLFHFVDRTRPQAETPAKRSDSPSHV